jgi:hypothetical protein
MQYSKAQLLPSVSPPEINQPTKNMSALMEDAKSGAGELRVLLRCVAFVGLAGMMRACLPA